MNFSPTKTVSRVDRLRFAGLREHLSSHLHVVPEFWISTNHGEWQLLDDASQTKQLAVCNQPRLTKLDNGDYEFVLPIEHFGAHSLIAMGQVTTSSPELWLALASSVCREWQTIKQNQSLEFENDQFARQTVDYLEEINFLKFATGEMGNADLNSGVCPLIKTVLDSLRRSVNAQTVELIFNPTHQYTDLVEPDKALSAHESSFPWPDADRLLEKFSGRAVNGTLIKNYCECDADCCDFDHLSNFVITPVKLDSQVIAWLVAINRTCSELSVNQSYGDLYSEHEFGTGEATIIEAAATIIATHIANVNFVREQELMLRSTVKSLVFALEAKDTYTCGHSERVALYAQLIARRMQLDELLIEQIYMTGLLHDIGKIGVSEQTLNDPGVLSEEQYEIIKTHPHSGWAILQGIKQLEYVLNGVLFHHEQMDGSGYPDQLMGEEIPLEARILAVADSYDAMTSNRPYRNGMSHEKAASILRDGAGTQWDENIVAIFLDAEQQISEIRSHTYNSISLKRPRGSIYLAKD